MTYTVTEWALYRVLINPETKKKTLTVASKGTEEEMKAEAAAMKENFPDLPSYAYQAGPYLPTYQQRADHGVGWDLDLRGNLHHLLSPILGMLTMDMRDDERPTNDTLAYYQDRIKAALAIADEALKEES